jgi:drug/metabolite transporter (DMT)-like permease
MKKQNKGALFAVLAAVLYAVSSPFSKLLLEKLAPTMLASLLYLGAGAGLFVVGLFSKKRKEHPLTRKELPYTAAMVLLDIAAPIFLMLGLRSATAANVSLLNNFEIAATSIIALCAFGERISARLWLGIGLVTAASVILSIEDKGSFSFSAGSLFVLLACVCWGFENNCTRKLSSKDPLETVVIKGFGSGLGSLAIAACIGELSFDAVYVPCALLLGFVAYGLSIYFYIYAQRTLGAAKTSAYYAIAPFIGALLSVVIFASPPKAMFWVAFAVMMTGTYFVTKDNREEQNNGQEKGFQIRQKSREL